MRKKWKERNRDAPLKLDDAQQRLPIGDRSRSRSSRSSAQPFGLNAVSSVGDRDARREITQHVGAVRRRKSKSDSGALADASSSEGATVGTFDLPSERRRIKRGLKVPLVNYGPGLRQTRR